MEQLIKSTAAYKILCNDAKSGRLAHAYMLYFADSANMRAVLKIFAKVFFGCEGGGVLADRIDRESLPDCKIYPEEGKKFVVDGVTEIIADSALKATESDKKLYVLSGFDDSSATVQNKLLKSLEEPPEGVYFLLGALSPAPVLATIKSRVRTLEIPPFTPAQILGALERNNKGGKFNLQAAQACGGILGAAQALASGSFGDIHGSALEICTANTRDAAGFLSLKYADTKYKKQIIAEAERLFFNALKSTATNSCSEDDRKILSAWDRRVLAYAAQTYGAANADLKFNAYFSALLYSVMLKVIQENEKWLKL